MTFEIPVLKGFNFAGGSRVIPEFVALTLALSTYTAAFIAEIVRAGILSVHKGQMEAGASLGLPWYFKSAGYSTSSTSVDLPEPDTPVTHTSRFSGMRTFTFFRLC